MVYSHPDDPKNALMEESMELISRNRNADDLTDGLVVTLINEEGHPVIYFILRELSDGKKLRNARQKWRGNKF